MRKETNLDELKQVFRQLLMLDVDVVKEFPFIAVHPIFENTVYYANNKVYNLMDYNDLTYVRTIYFDRISSLNDVGSIFCMIRKQYRLLFLKLSKEYMSSKDFATYLRESWISAENPNMDVNVSLKTLISWFKNASKVNLMTKEDYKFYKSLPESFTVYRGVTEGHNPKGLSWTVNLDKAWWFANRWGSSGYVLVSDITKNCAYAYFNSRGEDEVIVDTSKISVRRL